MPQSRSAKRAERGEIAAMAVKENADNSHARDESEDDIFVGSSESRLGARIRFTFFGLVIGMVIASHVVSYTVVPRGPIAVFLLSLDAWVIIRRLMPQRAADFLESRQSSRRWIRQSVLAGLTLAILVTIAWRAWGWFHSEGGVLVLILATGGLVGWTWPTSRTWGTVRIGGGRILLRASRRTSAKIPYEDVLLILLRHAPPVYGQNPTPHIRLILATRSYELSLYTDEGKKCLARLLEVCPRAAVIDFERGVVRMGHPHDGNDRERLDWVARKLRWEARRQMRRYLRAVPILLLLPALTVVTTIDKPDWLWTRVLYYRSAGLLCGDVIMLTTFYYVVRRIVRLRRRTRHLLERVACPGDTRHNPNG